MHCTQGLADTCFVCRVHWAPSSVQGRLSSDMHISLVGKSGQKTIPLSQTNPSLKKSIAAPPGFDTSDAFMSNGSTREGAMHTDA